LKGSVTVFQIVMPMVKYSIDGINPASSKRVCFKLLSGLFSQYKYIPLQFCHIVVELELDSNQFANICQADGNQIKDNQVSTTFTIDDVVMFGDALTFDNSLNNSYIEALMSGTALTIPFTSFVSQSHIMSQTHQFNVNIIRSFTRLKSMFVSFYADVPTTSVPNPAGGAAKPIFTQDNGQTITASGDTTGCVSLRTFNRFYNPMGQDADVYNSPYELQ